MHGKDSCEAWSTFTYFISIWLRSTLIQNTKSVLETVQTSSQSILGSSSRGKFLWLSLCSRLSPTTPTHILTDGATSLLTPVSQPVRLCCTKQDGAWQSKLCTLWWDKTQFTCWQYRLLHPLSKPRLRHSKSASDLRCWVQIGREEGGGCYRIMLIW